jgi:hypothetical protein
MGRTGERDPGIDVREDATLDEVVLAATERVGDGVIGGTAPRQLEDPVPGEEVEDPTDVAAAAAAEEAEGEADEVPLVSEGEEVVESEEEEVEGEVAEEPEEVAEVEEPESLIPRDDEGKYEERFTGVDPSTLSPENQVVYKALQADYTRKRQADAEKSRDLDMRIADYDEFTEEISSDEGVVRLGVELARRRPEVFNKMLEKVQRLQESPEEADLWERSQAVTAREKQAIRADRAEARRSQQEVISKVTGLARSAATEFGIPFESVEAYLDNAIAVHRSRNEGKCSVEDVKGILGDYVKPWKARKVASDKKAAAAKAKTKAKKAKAESKQIPAGSTVPASKPAEKPKYDSVGDAVDAAIFGAEFDIG